MMKWQDDEEGGVSTITQGGNDYANSSFSRILNQFIFYFSV